MPTLSLFPSEEDRLVPAADRIEPVFWLRRLVIMPSLQVDAVPIRDIEFRRGLNIVQASPRLATDMGVVGHSIGKTLLTRLIRYSLGEPTFATRTERTKIIGRLPDAHVIAHWRVAGSDWCVARPLQPDRQNKPFAIRTEDWKQVFESQSVRVEFDVFTKALQDATWSELPELPNTNLDLGWWLKVLAFLTRDWQCGYRQFDDWRNADSESGVTVERKEAARLSRWLMNLIDVEELPLWSKHQALLNDQRRVVRDRKTQTQLLMTVDPQLRERLGLDDEDDSGHGLFAIRMSSEVESRIKQLQAIRKELLAASGIADIEAEEDHISERLEEASRKQAQQETAIEYLKKQLEARRKSDDAMAYARSSSYENCRLAECPMKLANRPTPQPDPAQQEILKLQEEEIEDRTRQLPRLIHECEQLRAARTDVRKRLRSERQRVERDAAEIERTIGRWETYREDVQRRLIASNKVLACEGELKRLVSDIRDSNKEQEFVREDQKRRLSLMSDCFSMVLRDVFGTTAQGKFRLTAFGLEPEVDARLAPGGAALSAMAKVLSFDLACLISSVTGLGHHPRFIIHDSPRSSDTEEPLFHKLFRVVQGWEGLFEPDKASFQYIITTTTPPPTEFANLALGFVRLTLSARSDDERLLRMNY